MRCMRETALHREFDIVDEATYEEYLQGHNVSDKIIPITLTHDGYDVEIDTQDSKRCLANGKYHVVKYHLENGKERIVYYSWLFGPIKLEEKTYFDIEADNLEYHISTSQYLYIQDKRLHCPFDYGLVLNDPNIEDFKYEDYFYRGKYCMSAIDMILEQCVENKKAIHKEATALLAFRLKMYKDIAFLITQKLHILECYLICDPYNIPNDLVDQILEMIESHKERMPSDY